MTETISAKVSCEDKRALKEKAGVLHMTTSTYLAKLIHDDVSGFVRLDILTNRIMDEIIQIEGLLSVMQEFNSQVFAVLLGRSEQSISSAEEKKAAVERKRKSAEYLKEILNKSFVEVAEGANVWGSISSEEQIPR